MNLSASGRSELKKLEGFRAIAYIPVPGDKWTVGYGFIDGVKPGDRMTAEEADERLIEELVAYESEVFKACTLTPNQSQFDAMVLLAFNIGVSGFRRSTVLKAHNRGDHQAAARAFGLWNQSSGVVYPGLTRRRALEAALYLKPQAEVDMPQTVDAESRLTASPINRASVVAGGTAALAGVNEAVKVLSEVKANVAGLGDWLLPLALLAVVVICGFVVYKRFLQRQGGWS